MRWSEEQLLAHYEHVSATARDFVDVNFIGVDRRRDTVIVGVRARDPSAEVRLLSRVGEPLAFELSLGRLRPLT